jgi:hypothetical protein
MALVWTQLQTEMSTINLPGVKVAGAQD